MALGSVHGRRHRKKGWQKRKKPTYFAGTEQQHREMAGRLARGAHGLRSWLRDANRVLAGRGTPGLKKCREALGLLVGAAEMTGKYAEERAWGRGGSALRFVRRGSRRALRTLERKFHDACVVKGR